MRLRGTNVNKTNVRNSHGRKWYVVYIFEMSLVCSQSGLVTSCHLLVGFVFYPFVVPNNLGGNTTGPVCCKVLVMSVSSHLQGHQIYLLC